MVRKFGRITIILLAILMLFWASSALSEINEDIMSEILSGKSTEPEEETPEANTPKPIATSNNDTKHATNTVAKEILPLTPQDQAIIYYNKGLEAINRNQEIEATTFFKKALNEYPRHHKSRMQLVQLYQKLAGLMKWKNCYRLV